MIFFKSFALYPFCNEGYKEENLIHLKNGELDVHVTLLFENHKSRAMLQLFKKNKLKNPRM